MSEITYDQLAEEASGQIEAGNYEAGLALYRRAITLAETEGEVAIAAALLNNLGLAQDTLGQSKDARDSFTRAVNLLKETESRAEYAQALDNLGSFERDLGNLDVAQNYHQMAQTEFHELGDQKGWAQALTNLAIIHKDQGRLTEAKASFERALTVLANYTAPRSKGHAWLGLGLTWERLNNFQEARDCYKEALAAYRAAEDPENEALTLHNLGKLHDHLREFDQAVAYFRQSLEINQKIDASLGIASDLGGLASVFQALDDVEQARKLHEAALQIETEIGYRLGQIWSMVDLAILDRDAGQFDQALSRLDDALTLAKEMADPYEEYELYLNRGDVNLMANRLSEAVADYMSAVSSIDTIRGRILLEEEAVGHFDRSQLEVYDRLVYLTATQVKDVKRAFSWVEQARAREFLRRLALSGIGQSGVIPERLQRKEVLLLVRLRQALADLSAQDQSDRLGAIKSYQTVEAELQEVWAEIELLSPEYTALRRGDIVDFPSLQEVLR
jgi:tetratricopeptide (TPR) repeat protein